KRSPTNTSAYRIRGTAAANKPASRSSSASTRSPSWDTDRAAACAVLLGRHHHSPLVLNASSCAVSHRATHYRVHGDDGTWPLRPDTSPDADPLRQMVVVRARWQSPTRRP